MPGLVLISIAANPTSLFLLQLIHFIVCILGYGLFSVEIHSFIYFLMQRTVSDGERREFSEWRFALEASYGLYVRLIY